MAAKLTWVVEDYYHTATDNLCKNRYSFFFSMIFLEYNPISEISESKCKMTFLTHRTLSDGIFSPSFF